MRQLKHIRRCWNDAEYYYMYVCFMGHFVHLLFTAHTREKYRLIASYYPFGGPKLAMERRNSRLLVLPSPFPHLSTNKKARVRIRVKPKFLAGMTRECRKLQVQRLGLPWHAAKPARYGAKWYPLDGGYR